jgi:hypothetical protein
MSVPLRLQPLVIGLTLLNLGLLGVTVLRGPAVAAPSPAPDGMLRGRGLQIVDDRGKVRASIAIEPASRQPDGSIYPETVLLRLITAEGRPVVKLFSAEDGAGMTLAAATGPAYAQMLARGGHPAVVVVDDAGKETARLPQGAEPGPSRRR